VVRPRRTPQALTPLELEIMQVLWRDGASNVQHVQKSLGKDLAYTTVQTVLNVLFRKGRVRRRLSGKAFHYRPVVAKDAVLRQAVRDLVDRMFGGSSEELVMSLIKTRQLDGEKIAELLAAEKEDEDVQPGK